MQLRLYLLLYWIVKQQKLLQCCTVQHLDVNMIQQGIELYFFISSGKTDSIEGFTIVGGRAG